MTDPFFSARPCDSLGNSLGVKSVFEVRYLLEGDPGCLHGKATATSIGLARDLFEDVDDMMALQKGRVNYVILLSEGSTLLEISGKGLKALSGDFPDFDFGEFSWDFLLASWRPSEVLRFSFLGIQLSLRRPSSKRRVVHMIPKPNRKIR